MRLLVEAPEIFERTVDGNGNALVEGVAVSANKCWDLSKLIDLQVFGRDTISRSGLDDLEVDVVGFSHCVNGS